MYLLSFLLLIGLAFGDVREIIEREIYQRYGDRVKVRSIKIISHPKVVDKIELDMEYGKARAIAYLYSGKEKYQAYVDPLWKVEVFIAIEDIEKGTPLSLELFKIEERYMKTIPSDMRIFPEEINNFTASTRIPKGTLLRRSLMKELPAIKPGDIVEAIYRSGNIELTFKVVAIDAGNIGKLIRVRKDEKILRGKVVSREKVEILQ